MLVSSKISCWNSLRPALGVALLLVLDAEDEEEDESAVDMVVGVQVALEAALVVSVGAVAIVDDCELVVGVEGVVGVEDVIGVDDVDDVVGSNSTVGGVVGVEGAVEVGWMVWPSVSITTVVGGSVLMVVSYSEVTMFQEVCHLVMVAAWAEAAKRRVANFITIDGSWERSVGVEVGKSRRNWSFYSGTGWLSWPCQEQEANQIWCGFLHPHQR